MQNMGAARAHMIGPEVTELLPELTIPRYGADYRRDRPQRPCSPHPEEALMEAAHARRHSINI